MSDEEIQKALGMIDPEIFFDIYYHVADGFACANCCRDIRSEGWPPSLEQIKLARESRENYTT